jgi:hypothetical protein
MYIMTLKHVSEIGSLFKRPGPLAVGLKCVILDFFVLLDFFMYSIMVKCVGSGENPLERFYVCH